MTPVNSRSPAKGDLIDLDDLDVLTPSSSRRSSVASHSSSTSFSPSVASRSSLSPEAQAVANQLAAQIVARMEQSYDPNDLVKSLRGLMI